MKKYVVIGVILFGVVGCTKNPVAPEPVPACERNNTGTLTVGNRSLGTTYTIVINGSSVATLSPGSSSQPFTLAAGVPHVLDFFVANTTRLACSTSLVTLAQCSNTGRTCAF